MDELGVSFANASISGVDHYESSNFLNERPIFDELLTQDISFIFAAGNDGFGLTETFITKAVNCYELSSLEQQDSPVCGYVFDAGSMVILPKDIALTPNFLWVGAVTSDLEPSVFILPDGSVKGTNIPGSDGDIQARWISAPGTKLMGPYFGTDSEYLLMSGTSQAAPLVTGAAAVVKGQFPTLSNRAVLQLLLDTANKDFEGYDPSLHGQGVLDIEAALKVDTAKYAADV